MQVVRFGPASTLVSRGIVNPHDQPQKKNLNLTDFEGGFDGVRVELTKVGLEHVGILEKYRGPWLYQGVQSVEEDESYRHRRPVCEIVTKEVIDY